MAINWTEIILALLGTNGVTLATTILLFKQKKKKVEVEVDSSILENLEKGFEIQGKQLEKAQREILGYQQSLENAYKKIQELYTDINELKADFRKAKEERDLLKKQIDKLQSVKPIKIKTVKAVNDKPKQ